MKQKSPFSFFILELYICAVVGLICLRLTKPLTVRWTWRCKSRFYSLVLRKWLFSLGNGSFSLLKSWLKQVKDTVLFILGSLLQGRLWVTSVVSVVLLALMSFWLMCPWDIATLTEGIAGETVEVLRILLLREVRTVMVTSGVSSGGLQEQSSSRQDQQCQFQYVRVVSLPVGGTLIVVRESAVFTLIRVVDIEEFLFILMSAGPVWCQELAEELSFASCCSDTSLFRVKDWRGICRHFLRWS